MIEKQPLSLFLVGEEAMNTFVPSYFQNEKWESWKTSFKFRYDTWSIISLLYELLELFLTYDPSFAY